MRACSALVCASFFALISIGFGYTSTADVRATWVPVQALQNRNISAYAKQLVQTGITDIFLDVWNDGVVYFPSPAMTRLLELNGGGSSSGGGGAIGPDYLSAFVAALAGVSGVRLHAWFEYGLMSAYGSASSNAFSQIAQQLGWTLGESGGYVWMDPRNDDVLAFLSDIMSDALRAAPNLTSVQLDDHFCLPSTFAWSNPEIVTTAARTVLARLPPGKVTLSPATITFALQQYNVNWKYWYATNIGFAVYYPQIYRTTASAFDSELDNTVTQLESSKGVVAGIRSDGTPMTTWSEVELMLAKSSSAGVGIAIWDSESVAITYHEQLEKRWVGESEEESDPIPISSSSEEDSGSNGLAGPRPGVVIGISAGGAFIVVVAVVAVLVSRRDRARSTQRKARKGVKLRETLVE